MSAEPQDNEQELWKSVLRTLREVVGPQVFATWFSPVVFAGCSDHGCEIIVPTDTFRQCLMQNHSAVLNDAITRVTGARHTLKISVASPEPAGAAAVFPVLRACELEVAQTPETWLIDRLWAAGAAGFVSGPPKSLKTWTVLEMAVSVASGTPCFGSFAVPHPGPVLLYAAEDPMPALRLRMQALARNHGLTIDQIDIRVITADSLRLDCAVDREKLAATVSLHHPALVILDPLVRLHGQDENQSGPMAELLGHIRALQRTTGAAFTIVHHSRKQGAHSAGQSLRGSSDLYAFLDSLVSLQRRHGRLTLSAEHRSAPGLGPIALELVVGSEHEHEPLLRLSTAAADDPPDRNPLQNRLITLLSESPAPLTADSIRGVLQVRKQRLLATLRDLCGSGLILRDVRGYRLP